jgi:hypothetical protein
MLRSATRNASFSEFCAEAFAIVIRLDKVVTVPMVSSCLAKPVVAVVRPLVSIQALILSNVTDLFVSQASREDVTVVADDEATS